MNRSVQRPHWTPASQGTDYELTEELAPLAKVKDYCSVLSGFDNKAGYGRRGHHDGDVPQGHEAGDVPHSVVIQQIARVVARQGELGEHDERRALRERGFCRLTHEGGIALHVTDCRVQLCD